MVAPGPDRVICWFRKDLRLHDNGVLHKAVTMGAREIVPVFCFDPREYGPAAFLKLGGQHKTGGRRAQFILESIEDLRNRLRALGSHLIVSKERPEDWIPKLCSRQNCVVLAHSEMCTEEQRVEKALATALAKQGARLELIKGGHTMFHRDDLPFQLSSMPDVFTPMRHKVEKYAQVRACFPTPAKGSLPMPKELGVPTNAELPSLEELGVPAPEADFVRKGPHPMAALAFKGGESSALARVKYYLWDSDKVATYKETRNGMIGGDYSTKFEPWLSAGCLSARFVHAEIKRYEKVRVANKSTYWVCFELLWRDYFQWFALKHGNRIFLIDGPAQKHQKWQTDNALLEKWKTGQTGIPLVDANMRELALTGFQSNRGRQNVASYLALTLGLDWRLGAEHFESTLIGYDPASNWGNWAHAAGVAHRGRLNRFNQVKQAKDYDRDGKYVKRWCPELARIPAPLCHEPWKMTDADQQRYGCRLGVDYPRPPKNSERPSWDGPSRNFNNKRGRNDSNRRGYHTKNRGSGRQTRAEKYMQ